MKTKQVAMTWLVGEVKSFPSGKAAIMENDGTNAVFEYVEGDLRGNRFTYKLPPPPPPPRSRRERRPGAPREVRDSDRQLKDIAPELLCPMTVGYFLSHAELSIEAHPDAKKYGSFLTKYCSLTGAGLTADESAKVYMRDENDPNKWGHEMRIRFQASQGVIDFLCLQECSERTSGDDELGRYLYRGNKAFWSMVEMGFRLGSGHDLAKIRSRFTSDSLAEFETGMAMSASRAPELQEAMEPAIA